MSHRAIRTRWFKWIAFGVALTTSPCTEAQTSGLPINQATPTADGEFLDQVLLRVKQEVGLFLLSSAEWHKTYKTELADAGIRNASKMCGTGDINFNIKQIKMTFQVVSGTTGSGELALKIPFGPAGAGSISPGIKGSSALTKTNTLEYTYYMRDGQQDVGTIPEVVSKNAVIEPTLAALRRGVMLATAQKPCMKDTPQDKDNTFTFDVELKSEKNSDLGFSFLVLSANASHDRSDARTNTIVVTFHPTRTGGTLK